MTSLQPAWEATLGRIPGDGLKGEGAPRHVLGTLMHAPATLGTFLEWWVTSKQQMAFSVREQELVILHMAVLYRSEYVWRHHVVVGREFGITEAELEGVRTGDLAAVASPRERAMLELTTEIVSARTIGDAAWDAWGARLTTLEVVELIGLVAQYVLFAVTNNAFRVALEPAMLPVPGLSGDAGPVDEGDGEG
jgi:alkylhydroperoxidase family enzyme